MTTQEDQDKNIKCYRCHEKFSNVRYSGKEEDYKEKKWYCDLCFGFVQGIQQERERQERKFKRFVDKLKEKISLEINIEKESRERAIKLGNPECLLNGTFILKLREINEEIDRLIKEELKSLIHNSENTNVKTNDDDTSHQIRQQVKAKEFHTKRGNLSTSTQSQDTKSSLNSPMGKGN